MNLDLSGKLVLVTGGSKGVGRAVVELFLAEGAQVLTCARQANSDLPAVRAGRPRNPGRLRNIGRRSQATAG